MITLHFYLDIRAVKPGSPAPLKLGVGKRQRTAYILTGVSLLPSEWDARLQRVIKHPRAKVLNSDLARMKAQAEDFLRPLIYNGELADLSATEIRDIVKSHFYGHFTAVKLSDIYLPFAASKAPGTGVVYREAWRRLLLWKPTAEDMPLQSLTPSQVEAFHTWLLDSYKPNTVVSTLRCLRAAWGEAVRLGKASGNPFAGIRMIPAPTHGRDLSLEQMRRLWRVEPRDKQEAAALDFFKLSFLLRAINPADLLSVSPSDISNGRLYYTRQKTGKPVSAKIEPEAAEIIARRGDARHLVAITILPRSYANIASMTLKRIAKREGLPPVTMYYARHTLASLLFEQGGSMDVVSAILSHTLGGAKVTATYVAVREARLDEAMRRVIDAVVLAPELEHDPESGGCCEHPEGA